MFVSINFYFHQDEFLCSSLSFFENKASILFIKKCHFGVVKIVSVSSQIFISENVPKNDFEINICQPVKSCVNGVCTTQNKN